MRQKQPLLTHLTQSFRDAFRGLYTTWREERNFRIEIIIAVVVLITLIKFNFSYDEIGLAMLAIVLVLSSEITNTAFEDTLNKIEPNQDPAIGRIKDVSAGVVVINVLGAFVIGIIIFVHHFFL
jgi:undecaprenol kinase